MLSLMFYELRKLQLYQQYQILLIFYNGIFNFIKMLTLNDL